MVETELDIEQRAPPSEISLEARAVASQGKAGRVKLEPDGSGGWRVIADGKANPGQGPPVDIPAQQWDDENTPALGQQDFDDFAAEVADLAQSRKQITKNHGRAGAPGYWRITLNYDDPRFNR